MASYKCRTQLEHYKWTKGVDMGLWGLKPPRRDQREPDDHYWCACETFLTGLCTTLAGLRQRVIFDLLSVLFAFLVGTCDV